MCQHFVKSGLIFVLVVSTAVPLTPTRQLGLCANVTTSGIATRNLRWSNFLSDHEPFLLNGCNSYHSLCGAHLTIKQWVCTKDEWIVSQYDAKLLAEMSKFLNFTYSIEPSCPDSRFKSFVSDFNAGRLDLLTGSFITLQRKQMVRFLHPVIKTTMGIIIKMPEKARDLHTFFVLAPFDSSTWLMTVAFGAICGVMLTYYDALISGTWKAEFKHKIGKVLQYCYGLLVNQGGVYVPSRLTSYIFITCWMMSALVVVNLYTGTLVSFLSVQSKVS